MPLTLPAALDAAVQFEVINLCHLISITRQDGFVLRLTDATEDVRIVDDLYRSDIGFTASALLIGVNLNQVQGLSLTIALTGDAAGISESDLKTRRYDAAVVEYSECLRTDPANSKLVLFKGKVGRNSLTDLDKADLEVLPFTDDSIQYADETYSQSCRASLGDVRCRFPVESFGVNFTVISVVNRTAFVVDTFGVSAPGRPDIDYFAQGQLKWLTGGNALWECDVLRSDTSTKQITLFFPTPVSVAVGDTGRVYPGCDRNLSTCASKFDNVLNYRGEPFAPQWG